MEFAEHPDKTKKSSSDSISSDEGESFGINEVKTENFDIKKEFIDGIQHEEEFHSIENISLDQNNLLKMEETDEEEVTDSDDEEETEHESNDSKPFNCHLCDYGSTRKYHVQAHIETVHLELRRFKCVLCSYTTNSNPIFKCHLNCSHFKPSVIYAIMLLIRMICLLFMAHIKSAHTNPVQFECHPCDYASHRRNNLKKHIECIHTNLRQFKCSLCNFTSN